MGPAGEEIEQDTQQAEIVADHEEDDGEYEVEAAETSEEEAVAGSASSSRSSSPSSSSLEEEVIEDDQQQVIEQVIEENGDVQRQEINHQGSVFVNVVTRNVKKVEWPPKEGAHQSPTLLPPSRRFKKEWNFPAANKPASSYPFNRGYNPAKLEVETIWKHGEESNNTTSIGRPKVVLRDASDVLTSEVGSSCTHYRMPPGTSRTRKCQETYETAVGGEKKV